MNQSFETEAKGFTFTFQPNADLDSEVEIIEQAKDNDQSDEDTMSSIYVPSSEPTPPPSPSAPLSRPTTPSYSSSPPPQSELEPTEVPTGSKRNQNTPSPELKKVKRQVTSAIRHALELSTEAKDGQSAKHGLLNYFSKGTQEDRKAYFLREDERSNEARLQAVVNAKDLDARKRVRGKDLARERQRKHRQLVKNQEIRSGERSPGGTKRKVSNLQKKRQQV